MIEIEIDMMSDVAGIRRVLEYREAKFAIMAALNRGLKAGKTEIRRSIRERYTAKAGRINSTIKVNDVTYDDMAGSIVVKDRMVNLMDYKTTPKKRSKKAKVKSTILKSSGPKVYKHAFVLNGKVWRRRSRARLPIVPVYGPAIAHLANATQVKERTGKKITETYDKRLTHEVSRRLGREWNRA